MQFLIKIVRRLSRADIAFFLMPALIALLFVGTIAQKYMGLYAAHKMFFASFVFWWGFIPLPGGYLIITFITLSLALKFIFHSDWSFAKSGINLTHLGVLLLLIGGFITAFHAKESYMIIPEGQQSPYLYDYIDRELLVASGQDVRAIPFDNLKAGKDIFLPFTLRVLESCQNCKIEKRTETGQDFSNKPLRDFSAFMALTQKTPARDPEENMSGVTFELSDLSDEQNGIYIAFEGMPRPIIIKANDRDYAIILGKAQRALPFALKLNDFKKETYPGTNKARTYSSELTVLDGDIKWPARVEMNEPLRYKGYTFFQSSFEQSPDGEITILSVVENKGRLFPYIGTLIITIGLLLQIVIVLKKRRRT